MTANIFPASHSSWFGMDRKRRNILYAEHLADPFIDREGYVRFIDGAEKRFRRVLSDQQ